MFSLMACAKVNLTLEVLGKRPDGYHEIVTVLQAVSLCDELSFEVANDLLVETEGAALQPEENLVLRAARLLRQGYNVGEGARIRLTKRIPMAAGLGGGSTDAAAALMGLTRLWGLGLGPGQLVPLAASLGSDVPFFLYGGTALGQGRGELVTPLPPLPPTPMVLLKPPVDLPRKTATLYGAVRPSMYTQGEVTRQLVGNLRNGRPISPAELFNVFEQVAYEVFPGLAEFREELLKAGARRVHLAGSGPTLFAITQTEEEAEGAVARLARRGLEAYLAVTTGVSEPCITS